jgi:hypothetical protein
MRGKSNVIKRNVENVWGARYTLGARYLPKNTVFYYSKLYVLSVNVPAVGSFIPKNTQNVT